MTPFDDWDKPQAYDVLSDSSDSDKSKDGDADNGKNAPSLPPESVRCNLRDPQ